MSDTEFKPNDLVKYVHNSDWQGCICKVKHVYKADLEVIIVRPGKNNKATWASGYNRGLIAKHKFVLLDKKEAIMNKIKDLDNKYIIRQKRKQDEMSML